MEFLLSRDVCSHLDVIILLSSKDDIWMYGENLAEFSLAHELSLD